jgi:uncharacterized membrane protein
MDMYLVVKMVHIVSSTILFGFGLGTAWYFWAAHRTHNPATIAAVGRMVVQADFIFTGTSGIAQPTTGLWLARLSGHSPDEAWLVVAYVLYVAAFLCWVPVVGLQIKAQRLAKVAESSEQPLSAEYFHAMRLWFLLGWPAFFSLLGTFWLMVAKPEFF